MGKKMESFPVKLGMRQKHPLSTLLFNTVLEFLARVIKQDKEVKGIQTGKEEVKVFLSTDNMILYLKDLNDSTKKLLDLINTFSTVAGCKINI
jgi:hypothetical protein